MVKPKPPGRKNKEFAFSNVMSIHLTTHWPISLKPQIYMYFLALFVEHRYRFRPIL